MNARWYRSLTFFPPRSCGRTAARRSALRRRSRRTQRCVKRPTGIRRPCLESSNKTNRADSLRPTPYEYCEYCVEPDGLIQKACVFPLVCAMSIRRRTLATVEFRVMVPHGSFGVLRPKRPIPVTMRAAIRTFSPQAKVLNKAPSKVMMEQRMRPALRPMMSDSGPMTSEC